MNTNSFYNDRKFCPCCQEYVSYLTSPVQSYCVQCAGEVRIMSPEDWAAFNHQRASAPARRKSKRAPRQAKQKKSAV
jgi:hypothetical protein